MAENTNVAPQRLFGRKRITTSETAVDFGNIIPVLDKALSIHSTNQFEIEFLFKYYRGEQPILSKTKLYRPEINNVIMENHAYEIVNFKTGYVFGDPLQYVRRGAVSSETALNSGAEPKDQTDANAISKSIGDLNEMMTAESKSVVDKEVAECFYICGVGFKGILPDRMALIDEDESPFELECLDPKTTFVVYSSRFGHKPLMAVQIVSLDDHSSLYCCYTATHYFEIKERRILTYRAHALGGIPIIEYVANSARMGAFETVIPIMDAINMITSNRLDGIVQHVQSILKFVNCELDKEQMSLMSELGAVMVKAVEVGFPADVDMMSSELDQMQVQTLVDYLYQTMLAICAMPDREGSRTSTGDTGAAVVLRDGWGAAEAQAKDTEMMFKKSEREFLKIALRIVKDTRGTDLRTSDIDVKFTRNRTDNLLVKTQGLMNQLKAGIHPQIAIANSGLYSDPEQVYLDSLPYLVGPDQIDNSRNYEGDGDGNKLERDAVSEV